MADPISVFAVLKDFASNAGIALHKMLQGDTLTNKNALAALVYKDAAGNARYARVDSQDRVMVSANAGDEASLSEQGELAAGSLTLADVTGTPITLVTDLEYKKIGIIVNCRQDSLFQIVHLDDATPNVLAEVLVAAGANNVAFTIPELAFVAGSTGTQTLKLVAKNFETLSSLRGTLTVSEVQA